MPIAESFTKYGLFAVKDFLDRRLCAALRAEIKAAESVPNAALKGAVLPGGEDRPLYDAEARRTTMFVLSSPAALRVRQKLRDLAPLVAEHFKVELQDTQTVKFAVYKVGDFFSAHVDTVERPNVPEEIKERKVSVVIFLNDESAAPTGDEYGGGQLTFYNLAGDSVFGNFGLPVTGVAGSLIAFSPKITHEVTPVTAGERYVVITWYK